MIMITSATVLVLAAAGYVAWDYYRLRADLASELQAQAQLVLENSSAALTFQDPAPPPIRWPRWRRCRGSAALACTTASRRCSRPGAAARRPGRCAATASADRVTFRAGTLDLAAIRVPERQEVRQHLPAERHRRALVAPARAGRRHGRAAARRHGGGAGAVGAAPEPGVRTDPPPGADRRGRLDPRRLLGPGPQGERGRAGHAGGCLQPHAAARSSSGRPSSAKPTA